MVNEQNVCVCIPALNEEESISKVIDSIKSNGYENIVVIDGGSTDETISLVEDNDYAELHKQQIEGGKGSAVREAFHITDEEIIIFIDADQTYEADDIDEMVRMIQEDGYDHILANRFSDMKDGAMSKSHILGNRIFNKIFHLIHGQNCKDILTGFRAISREAYKDMNLDSKGFEIETELMIESVRNNHRIGIVPSKYYERGGESKLSGFSDGFKIAKKVVVEKFKN